MTVIAMSRTEIDRMGVLQDLASSRIKVTDASTLMGIGRRQVFRLVRAFAQGGPEALVSRQRGQPSNRSYPAALRAEVLGIVRERYPDFGPTFAAEKLAELHGIHVARETLRQWMMSAGLWKDRRARLKPVHQPRYRRECVGELIQIDGSDHRWLENRGPLTKERKSGWPLDDAARRRRICRRRPSLARRLRLFVTSKKR